MIARSFRLNNEAKSSVFRLVNYLLDHQNVDCRVGAVRIEHCESEDPQWAAMEMLGVQKQNTRAQGDKVYHLALSFHEYPTDKVIRQIEEEFCRELGFKEHQRISVMHGDTDNPHLHIVINKIHPTKRTMHEPYYDHQKLAGLCERMEILHGLVPDNHLPHAQAAETGARNMEGAGDLESLIGKIQRVCSEDMKKVTSWKELHSVLQEQGFTLGLRGNGLIISSGGVHVKASSVDRSFSKKRLEERLGNFEPPQNGTNTKQEQYTATPLKHENFDAAHLWQEYQSWVEANDRQRKAVLRQARQEQDAALNTARSISDVRAVIIRNMVAGSVFKRILHAFNKARLRRRAATIKEKYKYQRAQIYQNHKHLTWNTWLTKQAAQGHDAALAALRSRKPSSRLQASSISGTDNAKTKMRPTVPPVKVTGQGTYIFAQGSKLSARKVWLTPTASDAAIKEGLEVAAQCFGTILQVDGSSAFKERVACVAANHLLPIRFADTGMEKQRQHLLMQQHEIHQHTKHTRRSR